MDFEFNSDFLSEWVIKTEPGQALVDYRMKLAAKIYAGMKAKGWNQTQFAEIMGKQKSVVTKWLSGTNNFETDTLFEIQNVLDLFLLNVDVEALNIVGIFTLEFKGSEKDISFVGDAGGMTVSRYTIINK